MLRLFLGRAPRLEQARGPGAAATSPVLHPPNDTSVLRYIGPIMLRRSEVSQDRSTVGLKRRMKEVILPASPSCSCKTMYQYRSDVQHSGFGVGQKWSIADLRTSEEDTIISIFVPKNIYYDDIQKFAAFTTLLSKPNQ